MKTINAEELLNAACEKHNAIDVFGILIAETALWASPDVHRYLVNENKDGAFFPGTRRAKSGEQRRTITVNGEKLDDNTKANNAIKRCIGLPNKQLCGFEACHVWPKTCYDKRYHTAIANLVLLPRVLAAFSDHDSEIQAMLQYRSYKLYDWYPEGQEKPRKPKRYPDSLYWREPFLFSEAVQKSLRTRRA